MASYDPRQPANYVQILKMDAAPFSLRSSFLKCRFFSEIASSNQQQLLVDASDWGGLSLKMFFRTPFEPWAKRLGVSRICTHSRKNKIIKQYHGHHQLLVITIQKMQFISMSLLKPNFL